MTSRNTDLREVYPTRPQAKPEDLRRLRELEAQERKPTVQPTRRVDGDLWSTILMCLVVGGFVFAPHLIVDIWNAITGTP